MGSRWSDDDELLAAERDIRARLGGRELDFDANQAVSNVYRAAAAIRREAEQDVLAEAGLSWGGFTALWVLWIWGEMEAGTLAAECDLAKGTLTGILTTLEKQSLVERRRLDHDRRRVVVTLTAEGAATMEELYPRFHRFERTLVGGLDPDELVTLSRLLRRVIRTVTD